MLKERMRHGAFTVIDSTNIRTEELRRYKKLCEEYRYRVIVWILPGFLWKKQSAGT